ncbi:MAG: hypothetical protein WC788_06740 [Candidatus Paceibacterota bacterium]|jgi:hypothetical protein
METKTGHYWQDLNFALFEALSGMKRSPTINQKRDLASFMMHVLDEENGIPVADLKFRTNFNDKKFLTLKEVLTDAGLISEISSGTPYGDGEIASIKPTDKIRRFTREIYHASNGNGKCNCPKKNVMNIPKDAIVSQRDMVSVITIPDRKEIQKKNPVIVKPASGRKRIEVQKQNIEPIPKKKPDKELAYLVIVNKAHINEIREHLTDKGDTGMDLKTLFEKWKIPYSQASIDRLKMYLGINKVDFVLEGMFPKIKLLGKSE